MHTVSLNIIYQFSWHDVHRWKLDVVANLLLISAGLSYLVAATRVSAWPKARVAAFLAGLLVTFLACESVIGIFEDTYFSDHMIQHLLLIMVAAPLFAFATPLDLAYGAGSPRVRRILDGRVMALLTHPLVALAAYFVFIPLTHLTGLFNFMLQHQWVHNLEHVGFLVIGYLFFRAAFGLERGLTLHRGLLLVFIMAAVPVDTFTGLALAMETNNPFVSYLRTAPTGSTNSTIISNIHFGGAIMWIGGDALMLLAGIPIAVAWVRWETVRTKEIDAELDAQGI